jgi:hypothetical protein
LSAPTLVVIRHAEIGGCHFHHGDELPVGLLSPEAIDLHLDRKQLVEYDSADRRSLYRLLHYFSGCTEQEQLTKEEKEDLCFN